VNWHVQPVRALKFPARFLKLAHAIADFAMVQEQNHMLGRVHRITDEMMLSGHTAIEIEEKIT
jgi:prephenate dehydratase